MHRVRTLVRAPEKLGEFKERVKVVQGSVFEPADIEQAIRGAEAALSTVGPPQRNPTAPEKYEKAMKDLVAALEKHNIKRFIHAGGAVHLGGGNENWTIRRRLLGLVLELIWNPRLVAKHWSGRC